MRKSVFFLFALALILTGFAFGTNNVKIIKFDALDHLMTRNSDKIEVINFWATWCKPCIKELPYFQELHDSMEEQVQVSLISLDFADALNSKVIPFVQKRQITTPVLLLDEIDYNSWIDKVDPSWSGAIPATLMINHHTGERIFVEGELTKEKITEMINQLSN